MTKQEAIEQARKEINEAVTTGGIAGGYSCGDFELVFIINDTIRRIEFESEALLSLNDREVNRLRGLLVSLCNRTDGCLRRDAMEVDDCSDCSEYNMTECGSQGHNKRIIYREQDD